MASEIGYAGSGSAYGTATRPATDRAESQVLEIVIRLEGISSRLSGHVSTALDAIRGSIPCEPSSKIDESCILHRLRTVVERLENSDNDADTLCALLGA